VFEADDIRDWRGKDVVDADSSKIGTLEAVYFGTAMQLPTFASVKVGMMGRQRLVFVPLAGARVAPKRVRVMAEKKLLKNGPGLSISMGS
jgi:PRC-barrel domain